MANTKFQLGQKNVMRESEDPKHFTAVKGYDFNKGVNYDKIVDSFLTTGFPAHFAPLFPQA